MQEDVRRKFENPDSFYRSFPFWSWNGKLEAEELVRQVRLMHEAGVGGFFIHSRDGLETEYMGGEWMACVKAVVAEARTLGMYAWLYDEDRWPSGTAGGRVTSCGDAYRCKGLTLEVTEVSEYASLYAAEIRGRDAFADDRNGVLAAYAAVTDGDDIFSCRRLSLREEESFAEGERLLTVRLEVSAPSEWFNNEAPPDNLNPDCVKKFIEETHEKYKAVIGDEFGKTVPGIFTDEPSLHDRHAFFGEKRSWIPWTYGYGEYFRECAGYDFLDVLPWLYFNGEKSEKTRRDYWSSIAKRYGEAYFRTIGEWCGKNNLFFTGHFLQEDKMGLAVRVNGGIMSHYQYQHVPGIDMLCEQTQEYMTVKQCTSVAHQLGKKQVLTETYGCTGWEFSFEGQKWAGDWQYVLGVNRRCQHLALYSLRGCRKRDYPPSFNYNTNWWSRNRQTEDYFARLAVLLEQGEAVREILLLHPLSTVWGKLGCSPHGNPVRRKERDVPALNQFGDRFNELIEYLVREHLDCDLGDEMLIGEYGAAECGVVERDTAWGGAADGNTAEEGRFRIGQASYRAVVVPEGMETMLPGTAEKLLEYMERGGRVYALRPCGEQSPADGTGVSREESAPGKPGICGKAGERAGERAGEKPGEISGERRFYGLTGHRNWIPVETREELAGRLAEYRTIRIENGEGRECRDVLYQLRKTEDGYVLFLANNSRERTLEVTVSLPFPAIPQEADLLTGEIRAAEGWHNGSGGVKWPVHLDKTGSAAYLLRPCKVKKTVFPEEMSYRLDRPNVLPLDFCRYRMDGGAWSERMEVWQAQREVRDRLGMRQIYYNGLEQRYKWVGRPHPQDGHRLDLAFEFEAERGFGGDADGSEPSGFSSFGSFSTDTSFFRSSPSGAFVSPEKTEPAKELVLAVERVSEFEISLNGQEIWRGTGEACAGSPAAEAAAGGKTGAVESTAGDAGVEEACGWLLDWEFETIMLPRIRKGVNRLTLSCAYRNDMELENIYLAGDFGVSEDRKVISVPERLKPGDWTKQGLKHYCGSVTYLLEYEYTGSAEETAGGEKSAGRGEPAGGGEPAESAEKPDEVFLVLPEMKAVCAEVRVNGEICPLPWNAEGDLPVGRWLKPGRNVIEVEVVGSPRNMMGPFHLRERPYNTHDASFCPEPEEYCEEYLLTPYGIMGEIQMVEIRK